MATREIGTEFRKVIIAVLTSALTTAVGLLVTALIKAALG